MALIFHQNMLDYTGGFGAAPAPNAGRTRNQQFDVDFAAMQAATGAVYVVAGFTELLNNNTAAVQIANRAAVLDPGLTNCVVIGVGITVTGARDEHIGIAWDPNFFTILNAGQVLYDAVARQWQCYNTAAPVPATIPMPNLVLGPQGGRKRNFDSTLAADSRGVAYIHGTYRNRARVIGFMHNMYAIGDPSSSFTSLNAMMDRIHTAVGNANTRDYVGGDFNLEPRNPGRGILEYAAASYTSLGVEYNHDTTWSHPYDFWVTNQGQNQTTFPRITDANAGVRFETRNSHISDHAGITLRFPTTLD